MIDYSLYKQKFFNKIHKTEDCWIWRGCKTGKGYGVTTFNKLRQGAHVMSYKIHNNLEPDIRLDFYVCHSCDNPTCVNPSHLFRGTAKDNAKDMISKNRAAWQQKDYTHSEEFKAKLFKKQHIPNSAKLSIEQVKRIRIELNDNTQSLQSIADKYKVSKTTIKHIKYKLTWNRPECF